MDLFHPSCITMLSSLNFLSFPGLKQRWMKSLGRKETFHMKTLENSPTCLRWVCRDVLLHQGSPNLFLESRCPAEFCSNPNQTHLNQLIKVLLGILETSRQVCWGKLELNSAGASRAECGDPCFTCYKHKAFCIHFGLCYLLNASGVEGNTASVPNCSRNQSLATWGHGYKWAENPRGLLCCCEYRLIL